MQPYTYLIIGAGIAADAAVRGIRELDASGTIGIIGEEPYLPYSRPALTKGLWTGKPLEEIWKKTEQENVKFHLDTSVVSINPSSRIVSDQKGNEYSYEKLLLATGGIQRKLECPNEGVIYFRKLADYHQLRNQYDKGNEFAIIGSGYIAQELAASLSMNGKRVRMIFSYPSIGYKQYPLPFSKFLNAYFTEKGVMLYPNNTVLSVKQEGEKYRVQTNNKENFLVDGVIAGLGMDPNIKLAEKIDIDIENGIVVDKYLRTSKKEIFAAGDIASFYSPHLQKRIRIEHEDAANSMGFQAGRNMAGAQEEYNYLPFYYSDIFDLSYEAIGEISSDLEMVENWEDPNRTGAIYYLKEKKLRGAIFWGVWDKIEKARELILSQETFSIESLSPTEKNV